MPRQVYVLLGIALLTLLLRMVIKRIEKKRTMKREMDMLRDNLEKLKLELNIPPDYEDEIKSDAVLKRYDKEAKKIAREYRYSDIKTHNIEGEIISYGIYANEDFLPSRAILYFRGNTYNLDIDSEGSYYFTDDVWPSEEVVKPIKPLLPEISRTVTMFNLYENPKHEFWNLDTLSCLDAEYTVHGDAYTLLDLTFFQWHFYTERNKLDPSFPWYFLTDIAQYPGNEFELLYPEDALYQFIMGWMMTASPGFFLLNPDGSVGKDMMMKAHQLEPANPLYKWGISKQLGLSREETRALAAQVQPSQFDEQEPFIKDYFMELLQGAAQS